MFADLDRTTAPTILFYRLKWCAPMASARWLLAIGVAFLAVHTRSAVASGAANASSFLELNEAVNSGTSDITITGIAVLFPREIDVVADLSIESLIGATLSGGNQTRLFAVRNGSTLCLADINLADGLCARCHGGAILVRSGSQLLLRAVRISTSEGLQGGAIYAVGANVVANDCTMVGNRASRAAVYGSGGSIYALSSTITATNCTMSLNSAHSAGGAVRAELSSVSLTHCTMTANSARSGGVVFLNNHSTLNANDCTVSSNSAFAAGVVYASVESVLAAKSVLFTSNVASMGGGVIYTYGGASISVTQSTMTLNSAHAGGVICATGNASITIIHCVMSLNSAFLGGVFCTYAYSMTSATDCLMESNFGSRGAVIYSSDFSSVTKTYCVARSNSGYEGGVAYVGDQSRLNAFGCTMELNSAWTGGVVATVDQPTVTLSHCIATDNTARSMGGVVSAEYYATVIATDCTLASNYASFGGVISARSESSASTTDCLMLQNSAQLGGAIFGAGHAIITAVSCTVNDGQARTGGAVYAEGNTVVTLSRCTLSFNSVYDAGGAVGGLELSIVTASDCVMAHNAANAWGGAVHAQDLSIMHVTNCALNSNKGAAGGGGVYSGGEASYIVTDTTLSANVAHFGGAIFAAGGCMFCDQLSIVRNCTFISNVASISGGALALDAYSSTTLTDCAITSNVAASEGGAIYLESKSVDGLNMTRCHVAGNTAVSGGAFAVANDSNLRIWDSSVQLNHAKAHNMGSGALLVYSQGVVLVSRSDFDSNTALDSDDTVGIVKLGNGKIFCVAYESCWSVCTSCRELPVPMPSQAPQVADSPSQAGAGLEFLIAGLLAAVFFLVGLSWSSKKMGCFGRPRQAAPDMLEIEHAWSEPLLVGDESEACDGNIEFGRWSSHVSQSSTLFSPSSSTQLRMIDPMVSLMGSSPAPTCAIDEDFRVKLWSPGECNRLRSGLEHAILLLVACFFFF